MIFELTPVEQELKTWYQNHDEPMPWDLFLIREQEIKAGASTYLHPYAAMDPCYRDYSRAIYDRKLGYIDFSDMDMLLSDQYISMKKQPRYFPSVSFESRETIVYYVYSGNCTILTGKGQDTVSLQLAAGDLFLAAGGRQRTILCNADDSVLLFFESSDNILRQALTDSYSAGKTDLLFHTGRDDRILSYIEQMLVEMMGRKQNYHQILVLTFQLMLAYTFREYTAENNGSSGTKDGLQSADYTGYLQSHVADFSLPDMAAHFHMSVSHLCRIFKKYYGSTIMQVLQQYRIRIAQYLLTHTDETVDAIAFRIGYTDTSYFIEVFRKNCGCTPGRYRSRTV